MIIGFDIGGTNLRVAWSKDGKELTSVHKQATPERGSIGIDSLITAIKHVAKGRPISAIAGGITGVLDPKKQTLLSSPHLPNWTGIPITGLLSSAFHCPVSIDNDTALVGLGEALYGAGKDQSIVSYLTVSTGVGGARIVDGTLDKARFGFEPGHHIMDWSSKETFESLTSGTSNAERYQTSIIDIPREAWPLLAKQVAVGAYNTALFWSPDVIVLGGSMIVKKICVPFAQIERAYSDLPQIFGKTMPPLKKASLEDEGGLYGALRIASQQLVSTQQ
jgi:glucokinase